MAAVGVVTAPSVPAATTAPIVFAGSMEGTSREIWRVDPDGSNLTNLTNSDGALDDGPALSPDHTRIAYGRDIQGDGGIGVMNIDGTGKQLVTSGQDQNPTWSPAGTAIAFDRYNGTGFDVHVVDLASGAVRLLVTGGSSPEWSPAGGEILYTVSEQGSPPQTRAIAPDGSGDRFVVQGGFGYDWSPDGAQFIAGNTVYDPDGNVVRQIDGVGSSAAWSPDGTQLAYSGLDNELFVIDADGSNAQSIASGFRTALQVDWGAYGDGGGGDGTAAPSGRLAGGNRFATSVAISKAQFPSGSSSVFLARGVDPLVDAVSGGSLTGGPILLVPSCGALPQVVADELARLGPESVQALGGAGAICDQVLADAADAAA